MEQAFRPVEGQVLAETRLMVLPFPVIGLIKSRSSIERGMMTLSCPSRTSALWHLTLVMGPSTRLFRQVHLSQECLEATVALDRPKERFTLDHVHGRIPLRVSTLQPRHRLISFVSECQRRRASVGP